MNFSRIINSTRAVISNAPKSGLIKKTYDVNVAYKAGASSSEEYTNIKWATAATLGVVGAAYMSIDKDSKCCGLVGVVKNKSDNINSGYDSAGMATIEGSGLYVSKYASKGSNTSFEILEDRSMSHSGHTIGIAHTRWATHGGKTDENAHPHVDYRGRIALVHNGTINNANELRDELEGLGLVFGIDL